LRPIVEYIRPQLIEAAVVLLTKLGSALSDRKWPEDLEDLEDLPLWRDQRPVSLKAEWP
jgi:hypothetical protein